MKKSWKFNFCAIFLGASCKSRHSAVNSFTPILSTFDRQIGQGGWKFLGKFLGRSVLQGDIVFEEQRSRPRVHVVRVRPPRRGYVCKKNHYIPRWGRGNKYLINEGRGGSTSCHSDHTPSLLFSFFIFFSVCQRCCMEHAGFSEDVGRMLG